MTYSGYVTNGAVVLDVPVELPEGTRVEIAVLGEAHADEGMAPTLYEQLKDFVGVVQDMPADSATNLDHYLYDER